MVPGTTTVKRVLLTGGRAPATLELARTFNRAGHVVIVADSLYNLSQGSSAVRKSVRVPKPRLYPLEFARALLEIVRREAIDLIVPTCEEIFWLAAALREPEFAPLKERVFAPPFAVLHELHDKWRFIGLMQSLKIRVPETVLLESQLDFERQDFERLSRRGKLVLKPAYSRFAAQTRIVERGERVRNMPRVTRAQPWLAQDFVVGEELCAFAVARGGQVQAFALYRPGWRAGLGAAMSFLPVPKPDFSQALEIVGTVCQHFGFSGQIAFDFIRTAEGLIALECNPRATSGVHLFAPEDHLERAYLEALEAPILASGGAAKLGLPMLLYALPTTLEPAKRAAWQSAWTASRDVLRDPDDPLSLLHQAACLLQTVRETVRLRCSPLSATTADIEWNGEALEVKGAVHLEFGTAALRGESDGIGRFLCELMRRGPLELIENVSSEFTALRVNQHLLPVTVSSGQAGNAYVVSPLTHWVTYAQDELRELHSPVLERVLRIALEWLGSWLRFGRADDVVFVNNLPVSTNLHPDFTLEELRSMTQGLTQGYPNHAVGFRSVCDRDSRLPEFLRELGYRLIPARSVTFVPTRGGAFRAKRDVRSDSRLLPESGYAARALTEPTPAELERVTELYRLLYIEKYSEHNPRFKPEFMELALRTGLLEFVVLERNGRLDGVIGFYQREGVLTVPVLGYDTRLPVKTGLFRMLSNAFAEIAYERGLDLHASSGVAAFKRSRGGEPELEYTAVYTSHLPLKNRLVWASLERLISWVAVPLVAGRGL